LVSGIKSTTDVYENCRASRSESESYLTAGKEIASKQGLSAQEFAALTPMQFELAGKQYFQTNGQKMFPS
jgi:hypothetical protein